VIAVASTTAKSGTNAYRGFSGVIGEDTASYFSSDGAWNATTGIGVTISAPGETQENISKAGFLQSVGILSTKLGGGTTSMSGTSMASPHTAGVAALVWQKTLAGGQTVTPEQVRARLRGGAVNVSLAPYHSPTTGYSFDGEREGVLSAPGALSP
jgi:subtilisin family serine protease